MHKLWLYAGCLSMSFLLLGCSTLRTGPRYYQQMTLQRTLSPFDPTDVPSYEQPTGLLSSKQIKEALCVDNLLFAGRQLPYLFQPSALTPGTVNSHYSFTLVFCGGETPVAWSITGSLPPGLNLEKSTGVISGVPQVGGTSKFTVQGTDSTTPKPQTYTADLSIAVETAPSERCGGSKTGDYFVQLPLERSESRDHIPHCIGAHIELFSQPAEESSNATEEKGSGQGTSATACLFAQCQTSPKPSPAATSKDEFLQKTELVISSYLYTTEPADRLLKAYMLVSPLSPGVRLVEEPGQRAVQLIQVGTATTAGQVGMTAGTPSGFPAALTVSPQLSRTIAEQVAKQYTTTNVEIFPLHNVLFLSEDAGPGAASIDGNAVTEPLAAHPHHSLHLPRCLWNE